jgi:hypothetical protein
VKVYDIFTDLDPDMLGSVAAATYYRWLEFAIGKTDIGGKTLKHPSGRYASAISWKKTSRAVVSIIADESVANEVGIIEDGSPAVDLKSKMLTAGKSKRSKAGYLYRTLYLRPDQWREAPSIGMDTITSAFGGERLASRVGKIWAQPRPDVDPNSRGPFTMTNKPGSSPWRIPAMAAYAPAAILAQELQSQYGRGR